MKVKQVDLLEYLARPTARYLVPSYQRIYSWNERQCEELLTDALRAQRKGKKHFIGSILTCRSDDSSDGIEVLDLVDGQQRTVTAFLLLAAIASYLKTAQDTFMPSALPAPDEIKSRYLIMPSDDDVSAAKIKLSHYDEDEFTKLILDLNAWQACDALDGKDDLHGSHIRRNFAFFLKRISEMEPSDVEALWRGIEGLYLIDIRLDKRAQAQQIFESLNSKGVALNVADLVRNYLLLSEHHDEQTRLYEEYWQPIQEMFTPDPASLKLDSAIKGWLTIRVPGSRIKSAEQVYSSFKHYVEEGLNNTKESLLKELRGFCVMWAENYRYHAVKKFRSSCDWAINGGATLTAGRPLKKAANEEYAQKVREQLKSDALDGRW